LRTTLLIFLIFTSVGAALYFRLLLHTDIIYTHFMYIPIALACMWWGRRGMLVALIMAILVFIFHLFDISVGGIWNDVARIVFFGLVSFVIGSLKDRERAGRIAQRQAEAQHKELAELAKKQEEQLEHSTRLAELGEMAAAISHELNQPLTGIRNCARNAFYMLEKAVGSEEEVKGNLRLISEQVDRAAKVINEMRELTRKEERHFARLDINGVIRETVEFLTPQMKLSGVAVKLQLAEALPDVRGDRTRLAQVFLNVITNARQAMEESPIRRLSIRSFREPGDERFVVVEISDTGKGFSEEEAGKLFAPFFTTKKSGHGTGLGLSISNTIIKDHGGSIGARGEIEKGATFTIALPVVEPEEEDRGNHV
jgi:two-component system C4-dicarboxylate transport sensor histidine kinase DctB